MVDVSAERVFARVERGARSTLATDGLGLQRTSGSQREHRTLVSFRQKHLFSMTIPKGWSSVTIKQGCQRQQSNTGTS